MVFWGSFLFYSFHFIKQVFACMYICMYVYEHVWVFIFWLSCISCTYRKRKKKVHTKKEISGKSQNFMELLLSVPPPPEIKILSVLLKNLLKTEIELSPYFAISYENKSLSQIFVEWLWFLHRISIVSIWVKKLCNIHSFLFQSYEYQNATDVQ